MSNGRYCEVPGCKARPVVKTDPRHHYKSPFNKGLMGDDPDVLYEEWFCSPHAAEHYFPHIDMVTGYTKELVINDFQKELEMHTTMPPSVTRRQLEKYADQLLEKAEGANLNDGEED